MKQKIIGIIVVLCTLVTAMAQDVLVIPYDATSLTDEQRNENPTYMVYPKYSTPVRPTCTVAAEAPAAIMM